MITPLPPEGVLPPPGKGVSPAGPESDVLFAMLLAGFALPAPQTAQDAVAQAPAAGLAARTPWTALPQVTGKPAPPEPRAIQNFPGETFSLPAVPALHSSGTLTGIELPLSASQAGQERQSTSDSFNGPTRRIDLWVDSKAISESLRSGQPVDLELPSSQVMWRPAETRERHVTVSEKTPGVAPQTSVANQTGESRAALTPALAALETRESLRMREGSPLSTDGSADSEISTVQSLLQSLVGSETPAQRLESQRERPGGSTSSHKDISSGSRNSASVEPGLSRVAFEPLGIAEAHSDPGQRSTSVVPRSRFQAALPPETPITKAALPPWSQPAKITDEWIPSKLQAETETPVRFVIEDWNPDAPMRSLRITLEPRELGTIRIALVHRGGQIHARMVVDSADALHVVQSQTQALQSALAERGFSFGSFSLTVATAAMAAGVPAGPAPKAGLRADVELESPAGDSDPEPGKEKAAAR